MKEAIMGIFISLLIFCCSNPTEPDGTSVIIEPPESEFSIDGFYIGGCFYTEEIAQFVILEFKNGIKTQAYYKNENNTFGEFDYTKRDQIPFKYREIESIKYSYRIIELNYSGILDTIYIKDNKIETDLTIYTKIEMFWPFEPELNPKICENLEY